MIRTVRKKLAAGLLATMSMLQLCHADAQAGATASTDKESVSTVNVIFDTDIWGDIDDVLAFAMLHALHDRCEVNLLAVTISTDEKWCAPYVDLVNTFYGHSQVPVGAVRDGPTTETFRQLMPDISWPLTEYTRLIAQRKNSDGSLVHPRRLSEATRLPEAVALLRRTLSGQPDGSVVMIQVGFSTNLARLLESPADEHSALGGRDLVRRKVRLLSVMAGVFAPTTFGATAYSTDRPEANLLFDVPSAKKLFADWPTPLVATGLETGIAIRYPGRSIEHDYSYAPNHPIADTYRTYCAEQQAKDAWTELIKTCPHDHATSDLSSVLYAARPDRNYYSLSKPGKITVLENGGARFDPVKEGTHRYLLVNDEQRVRALEAMMMLASQPPVRSHAVGSGSEPR